MFIGRRRILQRVELPCNEGRGVDNEVEEEEDNAVDIPKQDIEQYACKAIEYPPNPCINLLVDKDEVGERRGYLSPT